MLAMWYNPSCHSHARSAFLFLGKEPLICLRPVTVTSTGNYRLAAFCIGDNMFKRCCHCNEMKLFSSFGKDTRHKDGLKSRCNSCTNEYQRSKYEENPVGYLINNHIQRWKDPEKRRAKSSLRHSIHADEDNERTRKWKLANPLKVLVINRNRRAKKKMAGGTITKKEWEHLKAFYNFSCLRCGRQEPEIKLTLDHVLPLSQGGTNTIDNAQPLCGSCNSIKNNKHIDYRPPPAACGQR